MKLKLAAVGVTLLASAGLAGFALFSAAGPTDFEWLSSYENALSEARARKLPIFAYLKTDWCGYCRQMEATTLVDPGVIADIGPEFVWLKLNAEKDPEGLQLRDRFRVSAYPAMILLDDEGNEIDRLQGYIPPGQFADSVRTQLASPLSLGALRRQVAVEPDDPELHYQLGRKLLSRNAFGDAVRHFSRVLDLDPDNSQGLADAGLFFLARSLGQVGEVKASLDAVAALQKRYPESPYQPDAMVLKAEMLLAEGKTDAASDVLKAFLVDFPEHEYSQRIREFMTSRAPAGIPAASH